MRLYFEPITIDRQAEYLDRLALCSQKASDYSFVNLWGWADEYGLLWAWEEEYVWIKQTKPHELFWAPVGPWDKINWAVFFEKHVPGHATFIRVPEMLSQTWNRCLKDGLTVEESRGHWDYLYSVTELIELGGNRFHKKKNLLNQFKKNYTFKYVPLTDELINMAGEMQEDWCTWRDCESSAQLFAENDAIDRVLKNYEKLKGLLGGAILVDNKMVAYTVAEKISKDSVIIHFEKGSPDYKGVYQAINQMFLEHSCKDLTTVNREQDLGDEGLRKAKLSYNPIDFIKKYKVTLL